MPPFHLFNVITERVSSKFMVHDRVFDPISHRGGRILPMAWKFRNSSNFEKFGTLALLDFSPFVIAKL